MVRNKQVIIEIIYALPGEQFLFALRMEPGSTVEQAIVQSGILDRYPDIDLAHQKVGVFSRRVELADALKDGDRIEIYRALTIEPKEARRLRALKKKKTA